MKQLKIMIQLLKMLMRRLIKMQAIKKMLVQMTAPESNKVPAGRMQQTMPMLRRVQQMLKTLTASSKQAVRTGVKKQPPPAQQGILR